MLSGLPETTKTDEADMAEVVDLLRYKLTNLTNGHVADIAKTHACGTNKNFSKQEEKILELIRITDGVRNSA